MLKHAKIKDQLLPLLWKWQHSHHKKQTNQSETGAVTIFIRGQGSLSVPVPILVPLPLSVSVSLRLTVAFRAGITMKMHARLIIEADPFSLAPGCSEDDGAHLPEPQGGAVKHSVLGVVLEAVVHNEAEVGLEGLKSEVAMGLQQVPHSLEVHRSVNVLQVVWHLLDKERNPQTETRPETFWWKYSLTMF